MNSQPLISVIIPVYNVESYLRECVESVINQTYKNIEIILVDDGSTDSSGKICEEYLDKDSRVTVIHQQNGGLSAARNTGYDACNGEYVYFLDSDDYINPKTLAALVDTAKKDSSDIVFFDAVSFADTDDFKVKQNYLRKNRYKTNCGRNVFAELTKNNDYHSAVYLMLFSRAFLEQNGLRFVPDILHEDMVFTFYALLKAATVSQCPEVLYHRRYRKDSIMTSAKSKKHFTSCIEVYRINADLAKAPQNADFSAATNYVCRCAFNVLNVYEKLSKADKKTCKKELSVFKKELLARNAHGNKELKMRCHGKVFWFIYKIFEKVFK